MPPVRGLWVRRLTPSATPTADPVSLPATVSEAVERVGQRPVDWAVAIGESMALRAIEEMPEFGGGARAVRTKRLGIESTAIRLVVAIDAGEFLGTGSSPEAAQQMGDFVHRRIPLERVWASIRQGHTWFAEHFMGACRELVDPEEQPAQLQLVSRILFDYVNEFASEVGDAYYEEEQRWVTSAAAARDETVRSLLVGEDLDIGTASERLRYDVAHQHHLALVMSSSDTDPLDTSAMQRIAGDILGRLGATSTLVMPVGRTELWAWGGSSRDFDDLDERMHALDLGGVPVAAGTAATGPDGFRRSHVEALEAARVASRTSWPRHGIVTYSSVSLLALLTTNEPLAARFVQHELGALSENDAHTEILRETLLAYLEHRRSPQAAAGCLFVAKNTVVYRVKKAEELLGRSVDERQVELWSALLLARGPGALGSTEDGGTSISSLTGAAHRSPRRRSSSSPTRT